MVLLLVVFFVLLLISVPVFVALGGASLAYTHFIGNLPDFVVLHRMVGGVDSFPLIAVPFFILAGNLMNSAGITNRIYDFATAAVGWLRGGLGHVNVAGSVIFAGMSGEVEKHRHLGDVGLTLPKGGTGFPATPRTPSRSTAGG